MAKKIVRELTTERQGTAIVVYRSAKGSPIPSRTMVGTFHLDPDDGYYKPDYVAPVPGWVAADFLWFKAHGDDRDLAIAKRQTTEFEALPATKEIVPAKKGPAVSAADEQPRE